MTLAAALIFGKDATIQSILPAYKVEAMVRIKKKERYDDRINPPLRTNLIDTYLVLKEFMYKHLPEKFYLEDDQRIDLRDKIFREVIGNAIVHREYTHSLSTEMIVTETEIRISNPNRPIFHGVIDINHFHPYPKNPNIRKFFNVLGWCDEIGSGIRNTNKYVPIYVPGARPTFRDQDIFISEIPLETIHLGNYSNNWTLWIELKTDFPDHLAIGLQSIGLPAILAGSSWESTLLYLVSSWRRSGARLKLLNWPENQIFQEESIKKIPGWSQKSTQLLKKRIWYFIGILSLCSKPIRMSELLMAFDYKNEKTFRDNYLVPLRRTGLITLTHPETPTNPGNRYTITEQGRCFLGGKE